MKKILKEQITQGSCANYQYMYNPNPSPWSWIDNIVSQFGITQNFGDYYTQHPNMTNSNCCKDENGICLGRTHTLHSNSPNQVQTSPMYAGQISAQNWKTLIDQLNAIHQANNEPTNFTYSDTWSSMQSKLIWANQGQGPINGSGNSCTGCDSPVSKPTYQAPDTKNTQKPGDDENVSGDCSTNPTEECWVCHHDVNSNQPPQSCVQLSNLSSGWVNSVGIPQGYNYYNTESDCMAAGPDCINSQGNTVKAGETKSIKEDIQRMKRLIKY